MATVQQIAQAFVEGKAAKAGNAWTDGTQYVLHNSVIAKKEGNEIHFDWCGFHTQTTANHMNHILRAAGSIIKVSYAQHRSIGTQTFVWSGNHTY